MLPDEFRPREPCRICAHSGGTMATKPKSRKQDRPRVSSQRHEIDYTASKVAGRGGNKRKARTAVKSAKKGLGRKTSRRAVMRSRLACITTARRPSTTGTTIEGEASSGST